MVFLSVCVHQNVVKVGVDVVYSGQYFINELSKGPRGILETKRHTFKLVQSPRGCHTCFVLIGFSDRHKMKSFLDINVTEIFGFLDVTGKVVDVGEVGGLQTCSPEGCWDLQT